MFSIDIDGQRHAALTRLEALELLTGAGYADELVSKVLVMAYEEGTTDVLSSLADSAGKSHTVTIRYGLLGMVNRVFKKNRPTSPLDLGAAADRRAFDRWAAEHAKVDRRAELKLKAGSVVGHVLAWVSLYVAGLVLMVGALWAAAVVYECAKAQPLLLAVAALVATAWLVAIRNRRLEAREARRAEGGRR